MSRDDATAISQSEAKALFADLKSAKALVLAVSGGPDSTALMVLAARWRKSLRKGPDLIAITVDHGLRAAAKREARDVAALAKALGIAHRTLRWQGAKPKTGIPQAAREARYRLLADAARKAGASHVLTAHTLDDQAETVLIRMSRGSGITGLSAMRRASVIPGDAESVDPESILRGAGGLDAGRAALRPRPGTTGLLLVRPFLDIPKVRLIATLAKAKIAYADDPTNRDAAFTRVRLRGLMPELAAEGLDARRLSVLARRLRRADDAIEAADRSRPVERGHARPQTRKMACFDAGRYFALPPELALRVLARAILALGCDFRIELAKLEALQAALAHAADANIARKSGPRWRRTLAGALVTLEKDRITVETAPARRTGNGSGLGRGRRNALTTGSGKRAEPAKSR